MASFTIEEIERACGASLLQRGREPSMDGVSTDTRTIETGNLFLALKGENFDGHAFLKKACEEGASGVILSDASFAADLPSDVSAFLVKDTKQALEDLAHFHRMPLGVKIICFACVLKTNTNYFCHICISPFKSKLLVIIFLLHGENHSKPL